MNEKKMISVVIPTFNRNDFLELCLTSLHKVDWLINKEIYEIIVTDDSPEGNAKKLIDEKFPGVRWVGGPMRGPAANRNNGVANAFGEWILFTDDDCQPFPNWISAYLSQIELGTDRVFEGKTIADRQKMKYDEVAPINLTGNNLWSCNFAIKRELFDLVGGFDEGFPYANMEDNDFQMRLLKLSTVKFLPEAVVMHPWRDTKPFRNFNKRLFSNKYFAQKYGLNKTLKFRLVRLKIFLSGIFTNFAELAKFNYNGWKEYLDKCAFDFCMIFI